TRPARACTDLEDFLADPGLEVVHVCSPNLEHFDVAKACLLAGKPVLCEKPLTVDPAQSAELAALAADRGIPTAVNFVYRHYPTLGRLKSMIETGDLGKIYAVRGGFLQGQLISENVWDWRVESRLGGPSRAMADIGSHWCDLARWLIGDEFSEICADFATFVPERLKPAGAPPTKEGPERVRVDTEDYASAIFRFRSGIRGSFTVSQTTAGARSSFSIAVDGSLGSARWERESADILRIGRPDGSMSEERWGSMDSPAWEDFRDAAQRALISSFYERIRGLGRGVHADFSDGHANAKIVEAALASAKTRAWIRIG
ncbi:MAG TPA: Gfo/Idh/MocA family oxidoreductase, partial [Rectinemataceae bacterium]